MGQIEPLAVLVLGCLRIDPLTGSTCSIHHLHVRRRLSGFDVGVDGFFDQTGLKLSLSQLTPDRALGTALRKLIRPVQIPQVLDQNLRGRDGASVQASVCGHHVIMCLSTCIAEVLTSNFLKMEKASSYSSLLMAMLAMSGAS